MTDPPPAIPAATAVIFRERGEGPPELLMVERAAKMVFAAGAMVFPGGRIDPGDHQFAEALGGGEDLAPRLAAIRETIEETGIGIGLSGTGVGGKIMAVRAGLHAGAPLGDALADVGLSVEPDALTPFARWRPAHAHMRIFDTRFYLARAPDDAEGSVDATENVRLLWISAADMLAACDAGEMAVIFPTRRNLERLAQFDSLDAAIADAARHPVTTVTPWEEQRGGARHLCIPDGIGYPVTSEPLEAAMRG